MDENSRELIIAKQKLLEKDKIILDRELLISEQKNIIKELHTEYKNQIDMQTKDFHNRLQSMAEKAIDKPRIQQLK